jgi:hypothetical protein
MTLNPLNHKRLSSTSRMSVGPMEPKLDSLPERRPPKDRGLPSPHPGWVIAQVFLQTFSATTSKPA